VKLQWVKAKPDKEMEMEALKDFVDQLCSDTPRFKATTPPKQVDSDLMNVFVFGDPHINAYCYHGEVGSDWDQDIALEQHKLAMLDMAKRAPKADVGILATMGDLFHNDSLKAITPGGGNLVDVDSRLGLALDNAEFMVREMIQEILKTHKQVKYICVRGNHSETLELTFARIIRAAYENEPRVEVIDNTPKHIPYSFGGNFLLFTHGNKLNDQRKADIVTSLYRKQHGEALFSHVLSAHNHHATLRDISGVMVETFPVLPTPDAWHFESGLVSAQKAATTLTYHRRGSIVNRVITTPMIFMG
jgi:UDP-2,3-diacylglucosamine pyrophosphatase LpxH